VSWLSAGDSSGCPAKAAPDPADCGKASSFRVPPGQPSRLWLRCLPWSCHSSWSKALGPVPPKRRSRHHLVDLHPLINPQRSEGSL